MALVFLVGGIHLEQPVKDLKIFCTLLDDSEQQNHPVPMWDLTTFHVKKKKEKEINK